MSEQVCEKPSHTVALRQHSLNYFYSSKFQTKSLNYTKHLSTMRVKEK